MQHPSRLVSWSTAAAVLVNIAALAACKARPADSAAELKGDVPLESAPPATLYHFGPYKFLHPIGSRAGTFTYAEWAPMPSWTPKYGGTSRAGFYVSQHPAYNERYEDEDLTKAREDSPWMLTVKVKAECLKEDRWLNVLATSWSNCSSSDFVRGKTLSPDCNQEIKSHIVNKGIGIVRDFWWEGFGFWYFPEASCIDSLDATPQGFLTAAANVPEFWRMAPFTSEKSRISEAQSGYDPGQVDFVILVRALHEITTPDQQTLDDLATAAETTDIQAIRTPLIAVTKAAAACARAARYPEFRQQLGGFVGKFDSGAFRLEQLNFNTHASNLVRFGISKLGTGCQAAAGGGVAAAEVGDSDPRVLGFLKKFAGTWTSTKGSILVIREEGTVSVKRFDWPDHRPMQALPASGYTILKNGSFTMNIRVSATAISGTDNQGTKFTFSK